MRRAPFLLLVLLACGDDSSSEVDAGEQGDAGAVVADDAGTTADEDAGARPDAGPRPSGEPVLVAVGYGGIRVRSDDDGRSWTDYAQLRDGGTDDQDLLRCVAWGNGRFVALGWRFFSSTDGGTWTERDNPSGQWFGGVQYGNGWFLGAGGVGECVRSRDGERWETCSNVTGFEAHIRALVFHEGRFYASGDEQVLYATEDGSSWETVDASFGSRFLWIEGGAVVASAEEAATTIDGTMLRGGPGVIQRMMGGEWRDVFVIPNGNGVFQANRMAFARGYPE